MSTYLTTQEVADRLGVSVFTIRRYIRAGQLRAIKLEGVYRIGREDMAEFLKAREIGGVAGAAGPTTPAPARHAVDDLAASSPPSASRSSYSR